MYDDIIPLIDFRMINNILTITLFIKSDPPIRVVYEHKIQIVSELFVYVL